MLKTLKVLKYFFSNNIININNAENGIFRTKSRLIKDRYEIHTLTNIDFMCSLVRSRKFHLRTN